MGDIVGRPGRDACARLVTRLRAELSADFVLANAENAAGGFGLTPCIADDLLGLGIDVLTSGNHVYAKKEIEDYLTVSERLLRPANYPAGAPGRGTALLPDAEGRLVGVVNLQGVVFMDALDCPFTRGREEIERLRRATQCVVVDFHAEATAEKMAFARHVDGLCSAVLGTHTHVQTADETLLAGGTAFISDLGMTGPTDSVIGMGVEAVLERFLLKVPRRLEVARGSAVLCGAVVEVDDVTGRAQSITRLRVPAESMPQ